MKRNLTMILFALLLLTSTVFAGDLGSNRIGLWYTMTSVQRTFYLGGALETLGALGLRCPSPRPSTGDIEDALIAKLKTGKAKVEDNFTGQVLALLYNLGCNFEDSTLKTVHEIMGIEEVVELPSEIRAGANSLLVGNRPFVGPAGRLLEKIHAGP